MVEIPIDGYAVGEDGVRRRVVSKQGALLAKALQAGFLQCFSQIFNRMPTIPVNTGTGTDLQFQSMLTPQALSAASAQGAGGAMDRPANYYLDMAEQLLPVIEVDAGRGAEFILNRGVDEAGRAGPARRSPGAARNGCRGLRAVDEVDRLEHLGVATFRNEQPRPLELGFQRLAESLVVVLHRCGLVPSLRGDQDRGVARGVRVLGRETDRLIAATRMSQQDHLVHALALQPAEPRADMEAS